MKAGSDEVFQLIRALTQGEKRYFSITVARYSRPGPKDSLRRKENKYLQLFRAIEKQSNYDEASLKRKFVADRYLGTHFKKAKSELYKIILQVLQDMNRNDHADINDLIHQAGILSRKGLHHQSKKLIVRAKKLAKEKEYFSGMIEACEQERSLVAVNRAYREQWAKQIPVTIEENIARLKNLHSIREIEAQVFGYFTKHLALRTPFQKRQLQKLGKKLFEPAPVPLSDKAAAILYNSMGTYNKQLGEFALARTCFRKVLEHFDNPKTETQVISYAMIQSNIIGASIDMKKYDEAISDMRLVQQVCDTFPSNGRLLQVQCNIFHALLSMYSSSGQFQEGLKFSESVRKKYFTNAILRDKILFAFNRAILHFGNGSYKQTLSLTNEVLAIPDAENPIPKLGYWSRLIQLLALWELGDYDLMGHRIKSFHNYVQKDTKLHKLEKIIFEFIRRSFRDNTALFYEGKSAQLLTELRDKIKPLYHGPQKGSMHDYFDFLSWVESKVSGKSFGDVVRMRK
jgi:hypothetical protein